MRKLTICIYILVSFSGLLLHRIRNHSSCSRCDRVNELIRLGKIFQTSPFKDKTISFPKSSTYQRYKMLNFH